LLALAALACAPVAYVEPVGVDISTLRIENQSPAIFGYELAADTYQDASACSGRLRLAGAAALPRGVLHTVRIAADHDFTLTLRGSGGGPSRADACTLAGTFRPSAGERYVAVFRVEERKCQLLFVRQQSSARRYVQEATYRDRHEPDCL
jgi:hypothetical protein